MVKTKKIFTRKYQKKPGERRDYLIKKWDRTFLTPEERDELDQIERQLGLNKDRFSAYDRRGRSMFRKLSFNFGNR